MEEETVAGSEIPVVKVVDEVVTNADPVKVRTDLALYFFLV